LHLPVQTLALVIHLVTMTTYAELRWYPSSSAWAVVTGLLLPTAALHITERACRDAFEGHVRSALY